MLINKEKKAVNINKQKDTSSDPVSTGVMVEYSTLWFILEIVHISLYRKIVCSFKYSCNNKMKSFIG